MKSEIKSKKSKLVLSTEKVKDLRVQTDVRAGALNSAPGAPVLTRRWTW
jgi:hypothetical protein